MSRVVEQAASVVTNPAGVPCWVNGWEVLHVHSYHREWIGALEGEAERDVWRIETAQGILELHRVIEPGSGKEPGAARGRWLLAKWED